jgi:purine-binding chemotaxis protein CheW
MADARKRAKEKSGAAPPAPAEDALSAAPAAVETGAPPAPPPALDVIEPPERAPDPVSESVRLSFDDTPPAGVPVPPRVRGRIELPSSGLAADILAREEVQRIEPRAPAAPGAAVAAAAGRAEAGAQSLSFFTVPVQEERAAAEATEHIATFNLDREEYGVEVRLVQEIRRVGEITLVPRAPDFIRGVINLRGRILPVVDLKKKLALGDVSITKESRIVVVRLRDRLLGLLVDGASQVLKVPLSRIEPPPAEIVDKGGDAIRGVAKLEDRLVILLDLNQVLAQELREGPSPR